VEGLVLGQGDRPGGHVAGQLLPLLGGEVEDGLLQPGGELLAGAVGGGDDAVELAQAQEQRQQAQAGTALEVEDEVGGDEEAVQEGQPGGAVEEGGGVGVECGPLLAAEPVLQGGAGQSGLVGVAALGGVGAARVLEVVQGLGLFGAAPAEGLWRGGVRGGSLRGSHGSSPGR
jgi:hypothetical protein